MTKTTPQLEKLIQMLRTNGVFFYKSQDLELHIRPTQETIKLEKQKEDEEALFWSAQWLRL